MDILSYVLGVQAGKKSGGANIELLENIPIPVDFSNGNQFVEVPDGQAVKSAIIQKPQNLTAENIAEGINIAGIVGTLAAGGGGNLVSSYKFFKPTNGQSCTVEHGLGVTPDIVFIYTTYDEVLNYRNSIQRKMVMAFGCSKAYGNAGLKFPRQVPMLTDSSSLSFLTGCPNWIDEDTGYCLKQANDKTITLCTSATNINWSTDYSYNMYFIGGLF